MNWGTAIFKVQPAGNSVVNDHEIFDSDTKTQENHIETCTMLSTIKLSTNDPSEKMSRRRHWNLPIVMC